MRPQTSFFPCQCFVSSAAPAADNSALALLCMQSFIAGPTHISDCPASEGFLSGVFPSLALHSPLGPSGSPG